MKIDNLFDAYPEILNLLTTLFDPSLIFNGDQVEGLDNFIFDDIADSNDKLACVILPMGFKSDAPVTKRTNPISKIKQNWQVVVLCPDHMYNTTGGVKAIEVIKALNGAEIISCGGRLTLVSDERDFNQPEFGNNMAWIPMMFQIDLLIGQ